MKRWLIDRGALLAIVVLVAYVLLAPTTIVDGDNAEFATVGTTGGRAHPSGYPAYVLYLRLMSWLPGSTPAHTTAIATCLLAALAVFVLHAACRAWGARPVSATIACAIYAASPVVLRMHTETEVFAGNALVVALVLWLSAAEAPVRGVRRGALLGLVAGLGLANHLTCVLVAPIGLLGAVRAIREGKLAAAAAAIGALALGLSAYAYLYFADGPASYGQVTGFSDVLAFFLREDYGGPGAFVPGENTVTALETLGGLARTLGRGWLWLPAVLGAGALGLAVARPRGESRWAWALLAACFLVAGPLLALRFNIAPEGLGLYVVQRFHLLPLLLLAIPVASGLDRLGDRLAARPELARLRHPAAGTALACLGFVALVVVALPRLRAVHSPAMERGIENLLAPLPPDSIVMVSSEDICFGVEYLQHARHVREDVTLVCWILTSRDWYRMRIAMRGVPLLPFKREVEVAQAEAILATGRPFYTDRSQNAVLRALPSYPHGVLIRVLPRDAKLPSLREVLELNERVFASFDLDYPLPDADDDFAAGAHKRYAVTWIILAKQLFANGDREGAQQAVNIAERLWPGGVLPAAERAQ